MIWRHNLYIKERKLGEHLEKNLIYCEETHSFVHRLFNKIKANKKSTYRDAQVYAFQVLADMIREYKEKNQEKPLKVPKPPKKSKEWSFKSQINLHLDCGNCRMSKAEVIAMVQEFRELIDRYGIKLINYDFNR